MLSIASSFQFRLLKKKSHQRKKMINIELVKPQRKLNLRHKFSKKNQDRKLLQIPRKNLLMKPKKKSRLNSIDKRVLRDISQKTKKESFVVTRNHIKKMNQKILQHKQRKLKMVSGDAVEMNDATGNEDDQEDKLDPMPILLFGDYDIEITKG